MTSGAVEQGTPGPWGKLTYIPIETEIPVELLAVSKLDVEPVKWFFNGWSRTQVIEFLRSVGLTSPQLALLSEDKRWENSVNGIWLTPDDSLVLNISSSARAKVYEVLARYQENEAQRNALSFRNDFLSERAGKNGLSPETVSLIKNLLYRRGDYFLLADVDTAVRAISNEDQRTRFLKAACRRSSMLIKVTVTPESNVDELVDYWGVGKRSKDIRPLLESLTRVPGGCQLDVAHLLPPFPRRRIYTFPTASTSAEIASQNCFWTAMNFFSETPDDQYSDKAKAGAVIAREYHSIPSPSQLGDLVLLVDPSSDIAVHAAVHVADGIVFTKNGNDLMQPWKFQKLPAMIAGYNAHYSPESPLRPVYYRRNSF